MDQDVSIVLSTEDHKELLQAVATKSAAQFSLIPSVPSMTSESTNDGHCESGQSDAHTSLKESKVLGKIEGGLPLWCCIPMPGVW